MLCFEGNYHQRSENACVLDILPVLAMSQPENLDCEVPTSNTKVQALQWMFMECLKIGIYLDEAGSDLGWRLPRNHANSHMADQLTE